MKWFSKMLSDEGGQPSSTRVLGALCVVSGLILLFMKRPQEGSQALFLASALLGVGQMKSAVIQSVRKKTPPKSSSKSPMEK